MRKKQGALWLWWPHKSPDQTIDSKPVRPKLPPNKATEILGFKFPTNHLKKKINNSLHVTVLKERGVLVLAPTRRDKFPLPRTFLLVKAVSLFSDTAFHVVP